MREALQDYLFELWTRRPWGDREAQGYIEADLHSKLNQESDSRLFQRLVSVYSRCVQRKSLDSSPEKLISELASDGCIRLNGEKISFQELARLVIALVYGEYGLDSMVYGPRHVLPQRWKEIESITGWARDDLIAISGCYRRQASTFLVEQLSKGETD